MRRVCCVVSAGPAWLLLVGTVAVSTCLPMPGLGKDEAKGKTVTAPAPVVTVAKPISREIADYDEFTGRAESPQASEIRSRVGGFLREIKFADGDIVKENDVLFVIDPAPLQAVVNQKTAGVERANAALGLANATLARSKVLLPTAAISQQEFDVVAAQAEQAKAEVSAAKADLDAANLDLSYTKIVAPFTGRMDAANVSIGALISPGSLGGGSTMLSKIHSVSPMYVYFDVDENTLLRYKRLKGGQVQGEATVKSLNLPATAALGDETEFKLTGKLDYADAAVKSDTGTIRARAVFENADRAISAGMFVRVRLTVAEKRQAILVPQRAVGTDQDRRFVYILDKDGVAQYRGVRLGAEREGMYVVEEGLKADETVVIDGGLKLRPGVKPDARPADMTPYGAPPEGGKKS